MKTRLLTAAVCSCMFVTAILAQAPKAPPAKNPADVARDEFNRVRNERGGRFDQARFDKVIKPALAYVEQHPTHWGTPEAIRNVVGWADTVGMDRKTYGAMRIAYLSQLKYTLLNERAKESLSEDAKAALAALDVALADAELRETPSAAAVADLRDKINGLAETPKASRFLPDREMSYVQILTVLKGPEAGEAQLNKLAASNDKGVSDMAKRELNLAGLRREPVNWKLKGIDGKDFDFAGNRGKVVAVYFWSTGNRDVAKTLDDLQMVQSDYRKKGVELVTVSYDKADDRAKLEKFIKENRVRVPVHFDGGGSKNEFGSKLNVSSTPRLALFDQKGTLRFHDLPPNQFEPAVKQLLEPPKKK